jgi:hypothetical protein
VVLLDSTFLLLVLYDGVAVPKDPETGKPFEKGRERVEYLIDSLSDSNVPILIPTPVLAEVLVRAGSSTAQLIAKIKQIPHFKIGNFDERAAIELAMLTGAALKPIKRNGPKPEPYQKVKFDRQIIAIAKVEGVTTIYSDDGGIVALGAVERVQVTGMAKLPMPPVKAQGELPLEGGSSDK